MQRTPQSRPLIPAASTPTARKSGTAMTGRRVAAETSSASLRRFTVRGLYNAWVLVRVARIAEAVERIAPLPLAEEWDNCGLQAGDPEAEANRVLVALTPLPEVFDEAEEKGADFLLFHHPLIFGPLKSIVTSTYPGDLLARAIRNGLAVYAAHTSYDAAPAGVSVALARALGLGGPLRVLSPRGALRKLVVFVPEENVDAVAKALAGAGAGVIEIGRASCRGGMGVCGAERRR